jgi:hypothetical protein
MKAEQLNTIIVAADGRCFVGSFPLRISEIDEGPKLRHRMIQMTLGEHDRDAADHSPLLTFLYDQNAFTCREPSLDAVLQYD